MQEYTVTVFDNCTEWRNKFGKLHRLDGPSVEYINGRKYWYQNGKLHRLDGPAMEYANGTKKWYQNGKRHRLDGPAVEYPNGERRYWIDDIQYTEKDFLNKIEEEKTLKSLAEKLGYKLEKLPVK